MKNPCFPCHISIVLLIILLLPGPFAYSADSEQTPVNNFSARYLDDERLIQLSDYSNKLVLLNFWASWCFPCRYEMPMFQKLYDEFKDRGLEVVAVAVYDEFGDAKAFQDKYQFSFAVVFDHLGEAKTAFDVEVVPQTFLIGRDSRLIPIPDPKTKQKKLRVIDPTIWEHPETFAFIRALLES